MSLKTLLAVAQFGHDFFSMDFCTFGIKQYKKLAVDCMKHTVLECELEMSTLPCMHLVKNLGASSMVDKICLF